jgi:hypothetical protein
MSVALGRVDVTEYLLRSGSDPEDFNKHGDRPVQVEFEPRLGERGVRENCRADFLTCKKLVEEAVEMKKKEKKRRKNKEIG